MSLVRRTVPQTPVDPQPTRVVTPPPDEPSLNAQTQEVLHTFEAVMGEVIMGDMRTEGHALDVSNFQASWNAALAVLQDHDMQVDWSQTDLPNASEDALQHIRNTINADMTRYMAANDSDLASDAVALCLSD